MKVVITIPKACWDRFQAFLAEWRLQSTRDKLTQFYLSAIWVQQNTDRRGTKMALGKPVVEVSRETVSKLFSDRRSQAKFRKLVRVHGLVVKDRSWVAGNISSKYNRRKCDGWHFRLSDFGSVREQTVKLEFDPYNAQYGVHMAMLDEILGSDGIVVNDSFVFKGKMAVDDWKAGKLEFDDLKEVYKTALQCRKPGKDSGFRSYDAISLSAKRCRTRYFVDATDGKPIFEAVDFNGAALACSKVAAMVLFHSKALNTGFGDLNRLGDKDLLDMGKELWEHPERDVYERLWEAARKLDPFTGALPRKWTKSARKTIKQDVTIVLNYSLEELAACRMAYLVNLHGGRKVQHNKRRQWLLWMALKQAEPIVWQVSQACRMTGDKSLFFNFYTLGEKMLISAVKDKLESNGVKCTRVHDAVWTSDERVKRESQKEWSNKIVAWAIDHSAAVNGSVVQGLYCHAGLKGSPEVRHLVDALSNLSASQRGSIRWSMNHRKDYCESEFPRNPDPKLWLRAGDRYKPSARKNRKAVA